MAWTAPTTRATGDLITAAIWNTDVVDNLTTLLAGGIAVTSQAAYDLAYASSSSQWARIPNGTTGQVLIATTSGAPSWSATTAITTVGTITSGVWNAGAVTATNTAGAQVTATQSSTGDVGVHLGRAGGTASQWDIYSPSGSTDLRFYGSALSLTLAYNGSLATFSGLLKASGYGAGTATFDASGNITSVSDERMKDRIAPLTYGLSEVLALKPIQHGYNAASGLERDNLYGGFSAQNVQTVMPLAVGQSANGFLTLQDRPILAAAVNAIKELSAEVDTLRAQAHPIATTNADPNLTAKSARKAQREKDAPNTKPIK